MVRAHPRSQTQLMLTNLQHHTQRHCAPNHHSLSFQTLSPFSDFSSMTAQHPNILKLFCLVDERTTSNAFSVTIPSIETVEELKDLIRKHPMSNVSTKDNIEFWKVTSSTSPKRSITLNALNSKDKSACVPVEPDDPTISELPGQTIHIIYKRQQ
ncbi:hypothetical protein BGX27_004780, partial [Mortierella sp. AM989]